MLGTWLVIEPGCAAGSAEAAGPGWLSACVSALANHGATLARTLVEVTSTDRDGLARDLADIVSGIPDLRGVLAAVAADAGISVLPYYLCQSAIDRGEVLPVLEPEVTPLNVIFLAVRAGSLAKPHIAAAHSHLIREGRLWGSRSGTLGDLDP